MPSADRRPRPSTSPRRRVDDLVATAVSDGASDGTASDGASEGTASGRGESVARAYEQLRELIVTGRLAPGSRIVES